MKETPRQQDLFTSSTDVFGARRLRDEAIERVLENEEEWIVTAKFMARAFILDAQKPFTSEDMRVALTGRGLPRPHHHNCWGGLTMSLKRAGLIHEVGMAQMQCLRSHARRTPLYWKGKTDEDK